MVHHHHGRRRQSRLFNRMPIIGDTLLAESLIPACNKDHVAHTPAPDELNDRTVEGNALLFQGGFPFAFIANQRSRCLMGYRNTTN